MTEAKQRFPNPWSSNPMAQKLIEHLFALKGRRIIATPGAPGAGKSALSDYLATALNLHRPEFRAVVPMDGSHFDDAVLCARGTRARKGAPFTFDLGGMAAVLGRLKQNTEAEIAVTELDHKLVTSRAGGRLISKDTALLLVEGNDLPLDQQPWAALRPIYDLTVFLHVLLAGLEKRLVQRWMGYGLGRSPPENARLRMILGMPSWLRARAWLPISL
jgi:pantothenate kinase